MARSPATYEIALLASLVAVLIWSGIEPHDRFTWFLEVAPVLIGVPMLIYLRPRFRRWPAWWRSRLLAAGVDPEVVGHRAGAPHPTSAARTMLRSIPANTMR